MCQWVSSYKANNTWCTHLCRLCIPFLIFCVFAGRLGRQLQSRPLGSGSGSRPWRSMNSSHWAAVGVWGVTGQSRRCNKSGRLVLYQSSIRKVTVGFRRSSMEDGLIIATIPPKAAAAAGRYPFVGWLPPTDSTWSFIRRHIPGLDSAASGAGLAPVHSLGAGGNEASCNQRLAESGRVA